MMKYRQSLLLILVIVVGCIQNKQADQEVFTNPNATTILSEEDYEMGNLIVTGQEDTCYLANYLGHSMNSFLNGINSNIINDKEFVEYLKENNSNKNIRCFFPRNKEESILLYKFTDSLQILSKQNLDATKLSLSLLLYNSNNVEYSEYGQEMIPFIALQNPENFIYALNNESIKDQEIIIEYLDHFKTMDEVYYFKSRLIEINDKSVEVLINKINEYINDTYLDK